jgi:electron transfer flavoprotein beta subunit
VKIAVCVKRVPDSEARIKPADDGRSIDETGVKFVLNPYDEYAVEQALQLRDGEGGGEVVAVSLGPPAAAETLRHVLAMGADRAVLLETDRNPADPLVVARALADELADGGYDLLLFGKLAIDDQAQAVGPMVATLLELPCVSAITKLELGDGKGRAERGTEGGVEVVDFELPAALTTDKGLNEPRRPALRGIMLAKKKPLETKPVTLEEDGLEPIEATLPPVREGGRIIGEGPDAVPLLIEALRQEAKVL